jgi:Na+/H+ antiporter NhaD/arsenite permease-like protein
MLPSLGLWATVPFVAMLLAIALLPAIAPHWWHDNRHRALVACGLGLPVLLLRVLSEPRAVGATLHEYAGFVILLGSLYVIAGGIRVQGAPRATPAHNVMWLAVGCILASCIGTTGAAMVLLPPVLQANAHRPYRAHVVVFFIFMVGNSGGLLTPLGDPPLFLGFLRGVPFFWTWRLLAPWACVNGLCLSVFAGVDWYVARRTPAIAPTLPASVTRLHVAGLTNVACLLSLVAWVALSPQLHLPVGATECGEIALTALAYARTPAARLAANAFSWAPIQEVAILFAGIFATMPPALALVAEHSTALGLQVPWHFFWTTGMLSAVLDNAPTYLTFAAAASAVAQTNPADLGQLAADPVGAPLLQAVSLGAVLMGALTYVGNGPNLMVRAIAEASGVAMPSFMAYTGIAMAVLVPIFCLVNGVFVG